MDSAHAHLTNLQRGTVDARVELVELVLCDPGGRVDGPAAVA